MIQLRLFSQYFSNNQLISYQESQNMQVKSQQIRKNIRQQQINQMKSQIRQSIMHINCLQQQKFATNQKIRECISSNDVERYFTLFVDQNQHIFYNIDLELIVPTYMMLIANLRNTKNIILLEHLFSKHFELIFSRELNTVNGNTVKSVYLLVDELVKKMERKMIDMNGALSLGLDFCLSIIKKFFLKRNYCIMMLPSINKMSYIGEFIIPWAAKLLKSHEYLSIMNAIFSYPQITEYYHLQLRQVQENEQIVSTVINNVLSSHINLTPVSYTLLSSFIQNQCCLTQHLLTLFFEDYLKIIFNIYLSCQQSKSLFKNSHLVQSLLNLAKILQNCFKKDVHVIVGQLLAKYRIFKLLMLLLEYQNGGNRVIFFQIIEFSLILITKNGQDPHVCISKQLIVCLLRNLDDKKDGIIQLSLKCLASFLNAYQQIHAYDSDKNMWIQFLENEGIIVILEELQFHRNTQIASISIFLLENEFQLQDYAYDAYD